MQNSPLPFTAAVNSVARNIKLLRRVAPMLTAHNLLVLKVANETDYAPMMLDLRKGISSKGQRKLDIELGLNTRLAIDYVEYDGLTVLLSDGKELKAKFDPTSDAGNIRHELEKLVADPEVEDAVGIKNTYIESVTTEKPLSHYPYIIRVTDESIKKPSNVVEITLHVTEDTHCDSVEHNPIYTWFKTTSSILLLGQSMDIIINAMEEMNRILKIVIQLEQQAKEHAKDAAKSAEDAAGSAKDAADSAGKAAESEKNAKESEEKAKESETNAKESETKADESYKAIQDAVFSYANVIQENADFSLDSRHMSKWVQISVPEPTDLVTVTIPLERTEKLIEEDDLKWKDFVEVFFLQMGSGTVNIKVGDESIKLTQQVGTAPILARGGQVASVKLLADKHWHLYGSLEDL